MRHIIVEAQESPDVKPIYTPGAASTVVGPLPQKSFREDSGIRCPNCKLEGEVNAVGQKHVPGCNGSLFVPYACGRCSAHWFTRLELTGYVELTDGPGHDGPSEKSLFCTAIQELYPLTVMIPVDSAVQMGVAPESSLRPMS